MNRARRITAAPPSAVTKIVGRDLLKKNAGLDITFRELAD